MPNKRLKCNSPRKGFPIVVSYEVYRAYQPMMLTFRFIETFKVMKGVLDNSVNPWTGRFLDKVDRSHNLHTRYKLCLMNNLPQLYSSPLPIGIAAETLLSAINANAHVISASPMLCLAEEACVSSLSSLCGWDTVRSPTYHS